MKKEEQLVKVMTVSAAAAYRSTYPAVKDTYDEQARHNMLL